MIFLSHRGFPHPPACPRLKLRRNRSRGTITFGFTAGGERVISKNLCSVNIGKEFAVSDSVSENNFLGLKHLNLVVHPL